MKNSKIVINGTIEVITGLHIGTGGEFAAIGTADSPVVRDNLSGLPIIPGSSIKGKMRSLLSGVHCPDAKKCDEDAQEIKRMFGYSNSVSGKKSETSRFLFSDCLLSNEEYLNNANVSTTEVKFENSINRLTGIANPRQIERVIRGAEFGFNVTYTTPENDDEIVEDFAKFVEGLKLIECDYLGGHGSRGSGKVKFNNLTAQFVIGENAEVEERCNELLKKVRADEI